MPCQLPIDCLDEIFEVLKKDKVTLRSCLLVNRLWCIVSVRILWRDIWDFRHCTPSKILSTLIACLPDESRELLYKNDIISIPTSKPPLFNYASFCKALSINEIDVIIRDFLKNQQQIPSTNLNNNKDLVTQEILKLFMKQMSSLKELTYYLDIYIYTPDNITFTHFSGAKDCLTDLSELSCSSNVHSEFFHQLSKICHNIQSLNIRFKDTVPDGLKDLISSQNRLKSLSLIQPIGERKLDWTEIVPSLGKHSNTITKLFLKNFRPLSFIINLANLEELVLSSYIDTALEYFEELQSITFPRLQVLKFCYGRPRDEILIKFLENNGRNLKEIHIHKCNNSLNSAIAKFCTNLRPF